MKAKVYERIVLSWCV